MSLSLRRGTNISHWLSQSPARGEDRRRWFTREDIDRLAGLGLDHLRLPVDEEQLWTAAGQREAEAWDLLEAALDGCVAAGLNAVVDLHILRSHHFNAGPENKTLFTDPAAARHFGDLWRDLSSTLRTRPLDQVGYELLNEAVAGDPADWNRVLLEPYRAVREAEPERVIAIGSNRWCSAATFPDLAVPPDDERLILVFHDYNPMPVTHYHAGWSTHLKDYAGPIQYPGAPYPAGALDGLEPALRERLAAMNKPYDRNAMAADIAPAVAKAKQLGLPLWCNEFGVIHGCPDDVRKAWYRDLLSVLDEHGIGWTNWDYKGSFGLFTRDGRSKTAVAEALLGG